MTVKPVGLLWDSVSNNTGDIAIGMVMKRFCEQRGIPYGVVDPFNYDPRDYATFIIGGGQLLRSMEDIFYRGFCVPGPHILNSVGIHQPDDIEYLNDYRLVSVRSRAERDELLRLSPELEVEVHPCTTMLFEEFFTEELASARQQTTSTREMIGIHLNITTLRKLPGLFSVLEKLNQKYPLLFIPFTHYENDRDLMNTLSKWLPGSRVSPALDSVSVFAEIGSLRALISSSMHAALFAYVQQVPALAFPQDNKLRYLFEERGFPQCLYKTAQDLLPNLAALLADPPDYSFSIAADKTDLHAHLTRMEQIVRQDVIWNYQKPMPTSDREYDELRRLYYIDKLNNIIDSTSLSTQLLDLQIRIGQQEKTEKRSLRKVNLNTLFGKVIQKLKFKGTNLIESTWDDMDLVRKSGLFDDQWYLDKNPDVAVSGMDPLKHFLIYGGQEGRDPGSGFSSGCYLDRHPEVRRQKLNPLVHYLKDGKSRGYQPLPED